MRQIAESAAFLAAFTPEHALAREAPGEWNVVEIVGHLADTERVFGYRALRSVRAIAYTMAGHELHHLASIRRQHGT